MRVQLLPVSACVEASHIGFMQFVSERVIDLTKKQVTMLRSLNIQNALSITKKVT